MKAGFEAAGVVVVGALLGSFLGKFAAMALPGGRARELFSTDITAGLHPTQLDLRIVELTLGCVFRFNVMSVVGIVLAALLYKKVLK